MAVRTGEQFLEGRSSPLNNQAEGLRFKLLKIQES